MTKNSQTRTHRLFSVSVQTSLKRYSERLLLFELRQPISDRRRLCQLRRKKVTTRTLHWDVFSSSHRSLRSRSYRTVFLRKDVVTSNSVYLLSTVLWLRDQSLGACACIHPFSSLLSMLRSHRDQWEACVAAWYDASYIAWRTSKEERRRTQEVLLLRRRGPARPQSAYGESTFSLFPCVFLVFVLDKTVIARASIV